MADDPTKTKPDPDPDPAEEREAMRAALKKANKEAEDSRKALRDLQAEIKTSSDKDKSDADKLSERLAAAEKKAQDADDRAMRAEVARDKGLTTAQASRLRGSTIEELLADADELREAFKPAAKTDDGKDTKDEPEPRRAPPTNRPSPNLRGGGDPTTEVEETDPRKLAAAIPRR